MVRGGDDAVPGRWSRMIAGHWCALSGSGVGIGGEIAPTPRHACTLVANGGLSATEARNGIACKRVAKSKQASKQSGIRTIGK